MADTTSLLRPTEAAVVAGVSLRDVHRVIDDGALPDELLDIEDGRRVAPAACPLIAFYVDSANRLTAKERRVIIKLAWPRLRARTAGLFLSFAPATQDDWLIKDEFLAIDFRRFVNSVAENWKELSTAERAIAVSPDILSGTPVLKGTRIPVHDVAASVSAGIKKDKILKAYPGLTTEQIDLSVLYARANPLRGRPRGPTLLPPGAAVVSHRRVPRRPKAQ